MRIYEIINEDASSGFKQWFAGSKAIDSAGNPLKLYHGTNQVFDKFSKSKDGRANSNVTGVFWFTDNPEIAGEYAVSASEKVFPDADAMEAKSADLLRKMDYTNKRGDWQTYEKLTLELEELELGAIYDEPMGANIVPVYLSIKNPLVVDAKDIFLFSGNNFLDIIKKAKQEKRDGVIFLSLGDSPKTGSSIKSNQYVVFKSSQIRSIFSRK